MRKLENSELDRKSIEDFKQSEKTPLILVLDDIRSLHNIGSVFRTADAFLIEKIYLCGITATPPNKEIHKTALGATETVAWEHAESVLDVIQKLKAENIKTYAIEQVESAKNQGATDKDIHDAVLIAAAFCMFNRYVDGLATVAPVNPEVYRSRAAKVVKNGYSAEGHYAPAPIIS